MWYELLNLLLEVFKMSDIEERVKKIVVEHLGVEEGKIQVTQNLLMTWVQTV